MTYIDVTDFVNAAEDNPEIYSSSVAASGLQNIGEVTWRNSLLYMESSGNFFFNDTELCDLVRDHFREYGAWEKSEIDAWSMQEINAMLVQEVASEMQKDEPWDRLHWDSENARWAFHIGM